MVKRMNEKSLLVDSNTHELKLGTSFEPGSRLAFHSIRYDFKPASVDITKDALVEVGEKNQVTVTVPHVEGSGTPYTVYKGNKRTCPKECVLIIDQNGTFTLEKLSNTIQMKKTRMEGSSKQSMRPVTPVELSKNKTSPNKGGKSSQPSPLSFKGSPSVGLLEPEKEIKMAKEVATVGEITDSSSSESSSSVSSSDSDSSSDSESEKKKSESAAANVEDNRPKIMSTLSEDLHLSESGSDSDV